MEVRFYTSDMDLLGIMENQTSLVWTRKYYEPGNVRLFAPITAENIRLTQPGNLVWLRGAVEAAVIEDRAMEDSPQNARIEVNGRFLSSYMDRRLIRPKITFKGKTEVAMRKILSDAVAIPRVQLGTLNGFNDRVSFQATYKNLLAYEEKLAQSSGIGFRFRPDFTEKIIYFETWKGTDRSRTQSRNNRVIFSESYANLNNIYYRENEQKYKNVVYISGTGSNDSRIVTSYGDATGLERRELHVDARDLVKEEGMTDDEYIELLVQRGNEKQKDYQKISSISCETDASANFTYKQNYDLGDIVTVHKKDWGITVNLRIVEIQEIYERGILQVSPVFGSTLPETIDWRDD